MSTMEIVLNMLAEATTTELSKSANPQTFEKNKEIAQRGGKVAGDTRKSIEAQTGNPIITSKNATELNKVMTELIEGIAEINDDE